MNQKDRNLSNPFSTGGGGVHFENCVQASFVALMLTGGFAPCLPAWPIRKIKLQGKYAGYETDDLIVYTKNGNKEAKLLGQIKHSIKITKGDKDFKKTIQGAWRDFNNPQIFKRQSDRIALITGPLSRTDTYDVREILEWARHSENSKDFLTKVELANFSSDTKRQKLEVFKSHLKNAHKGNDVSEDDLWRFMKSFYLLGYDLDIKAGVTLSLLHSNIGQYSKDNVPNLWSRICTEMSSVNKNAGTITLDTLPDDLRSIFQKKQPTVIPPDLITEPQKQHVVSYNYINSPYTEELVFALLIGSWNENNTADKDLMTEFVNKDYASWICKLREILSEQESPLQFKNGCWTIPKRLEMWQKLGPSIFDEHLDQLKACALKVLTEHDPQFDLPTNERYTASLYGKNLIYSRELRKGLAESLAILGSYPEALNNCTVNKPRLVAVLAVREILENTKWILWASLDNLLSLLVEAAPDQFLKAVEEMLQKTPCPFIELFAQEGDGFTGGSCLSGLLWALETLAWDEEYLIRVAVIFGELDILDPGGKYLNRPANSLTTIFLPWLPQTIASVDKRKVAIKTLQQEVPDVAWKILIELLPNRIRSSSGSSKPSWRKIIPETWEKGVNQKEYWDQVICYTDMIVEMALGNPGRLQELIEYLDYLPQQAFNKLLKHLKSDIIIGKPERELLPLWETLVKFTSKHRRFADAKWALSSEVVEKIEQVAEVLAPQNPLNRYHYLFNNRAFDLFEETGNWQEQTKKLEDKRQQAIREIIDLGGIQAVIEFAQYVENSWDVGLCFGSVDEDDADAIILPELLNTENTKIALFINGFVLNKHRFRSWVWADQIDVSHWSIEQKAQFLMYLPFVPETWKRVEKILGKHEQLYWKKVNVNPYQAEGILETAVDKLVQYDRPNIAVTCLYRMKHEKQPLDQTRIFKTLLAAVSSQESSSSVDVHDVIDLIKALQNDPNTDQDSLFQVEWAYLPLLDHYRGASPKLLEQRLASDPDFFCEVIRIIYRSKFEDKTDKAPKEQQVTIAENASRLLYNWQTPPGMQLDGSFAADKFTHWLESVKRICSETGHLDIALDRVGSVLIYCPPDPDGLWIHHVVAETLNDPSVENMREGFSIGIYNSRGVHTVDHSGKPEMELAAKYRQQASDVENHGYYRLASTLKNLADSYDQEAERVRKSRKY